MYYDRKISATVRERKTLHFDLELKSVDGQGRFAGYASVFNVVDNQRDIILPGAFTCTLNGRLSEIKLLWQHQQDEPIGLFDRIFEDRHGLYVEGRLLLTLQRAQEALALLKEGVINGLSIGYSPTRYKMDEKNGVRLLTEVELWEISLVTFPANSQANITVVKQRFQPMENETHDEWQQAQRTGQLIALSDALSRAIDVLKD
jgi:uncharacterized protein